MIWNLDWLMKTASSCTAEVRPGVWVPSRPINTRHEPWSVRLRATWLVLTGRADAVVWPGGQ